MTTLVKLFLVIAILFASTFVVIKATGVLTVDDIRAWLEAAKSMSPLYIGLLIVILLFADLFIAIPTLTVCLLAGYFLGFELGALFAAIGVTMAGVIGHLISRTTGRKILDKIIKRPEKVKEMEETFHQHGFIMILISRALPILPEATACLSGFARMPLSKFLLAWALGSYPYVAIAAYAGSVSTLDNPTPAIFTAIGLSALLWMLWTVFLWFKRRRLKTAELS